MSQITLRDVPHELDHRQRELARAQNKSLNRTIIGVLMESKPTRECSTNDVWIAAVALERGAQLVTMDAHFDSIPGVFATGLEP